MNSHVREQIRKLNKVNVEVDRFLKCSHKYKNELQARNDSEYFYGCPLESGALTRSSLDLTRSLAAWRAGR